MLLVIYLVSSATIAFDYRRLPAWEIILGILISHILLSIAVVPLVLRTYAKAYLSDFAGHRKLARITFPIWFYVAVSGVVVYLMISPYYPY